MIEMMDLSKTKLHESKYNHYEIANYSKSGYQSMHNLIYWQYKPYLGFGPSAASFYKKLRWQNSTNLIDWCKNLKREIDEESKRIEIQMAEFTFLSLRLLNQGVSCNKFKKEFGVSLETIYGDTLKRLVSYNWLTETVEGYKIKDQAIYFANQIFAEFLP